MICYNNQRQTTQKKENQMNKSEKELDVEACKRMIKLLSEGLRQNPAGEPAEVACEVLHELNLKLEDLEKSLEDEQKRFLWLGRLYDFDSLVDNLMQSLDEVSADVVRIALLGEKSGDAQIAFVAAAISKEIEKLDVGEGWWFSSNVIVRVDPKLTDRK